MAYHQPRRYLLTAAYDRRARMWAACILIDGQNHGCIAHGKTADEAIARGQLYHPQIEVA